MDKIKKSIFGVFVLFLSLTLLVPPFVSIFAEEPYSNTTYWSSICNTASGYKENASQCEAFRDYLSSEKDKAQQEYDDLKNTVDTISGNLEKDEATLKTINLKIESLTVEIAASKSEISRVESNIVVLEDDIEKTEEAIADKQETARKYMVNVQPSTRISVFVDFLMGGDDFAEISRRVEGMNRINNKNQENIRELNVEMEILKEKKADLDFEKAYLADVLHEQEVAKETQIELQTLAKERIEVLEREYRAMVDARNAAAQAQKVIVQKIEAIGPVEGSTGGMASPITSGFYVSASVWNYSSGAKHLGIDLAASIGTTIVAPANGVVAATYTSCATWGGLSNSCGSGYGNYVLMIVRDNDSAYGALYGHMQSGGVLVSVGQQISKGQAIGRVGSSGTSTGPHVHAELFYLGDKSVDQAYNDWYNGSRTIQFGLGGGSSSSEYSNRCDVKGYSANCRMNPSSYWGLYVGNSR